MYAAVQDLIDRYGQQALVELTDRADPPAGVVDPRVAERALRDASDVIDGFISAAYALPLQTVPPIVADLCCTIARFKLYVRIGPTDDVRAAHDDALKLLDKAARGTFKIAGLDGKDPGARPGAVLVETSPRIFSRDTMGGC